MSHNVIWAAVILWGALMGFYLQSGIVLFYWMPVGRSEAPWTYWGYIGVHAVFLLILLYAALKPSPYAQFSN